MKYRDDDARKRTRVRAQSSQLAATGPEKVNRGLRTLSAGHRTLLHVSDEQELLHQMCRAIVEQGGYRAAWVGYAQHDEQKTIRPMACVGIDYAVLESRRLTWADTESSGHRAAGTAIRTGQPSVGRNIRTDPAYAPIREEAIVADCASATAFPLRINGEVIGSLSILAAEPDAFDEVEVRLLEEMAEDLACSIATLRTRAARQRAEAEAARVNRALRTLSAGNRTLLRAADEQELLREMCRVIVEDGGYRAAWVGYAQHDEQKTIRPMACVGIDRAVLESYHLIWAGTELGQGASGTAIRTGRPSIGRNIRTDPAYAPIHEDAILADYASVTAFPLKANGEVIGNLTILAAEPDAFDEAEVGLLEEMAQDLAYGIATLRTRAARQRAEAEVARMNRALRTLSAGNRTLLRAADEPELLSEMCRVIVEEGGYRMAWVGYAQNDEQKTIRPMANAGFDTGLFEGANFTWADIGLGLGPTGTAVRLGKPVIGRHVLTDPNLVPWQEDALKGGYASASAFPLCIDGEVVGNLSMYATEPDAFDEAEARLLGELAEDLAYGIANLRMRVKQQEAERTIERMAHYDALTGLPNRALLREELERAIQGARQARRPLALLLLKVDQFREINDTLGSHEGDVLLREISARLSGFVKDSEMVARLGDDEFAVLLPGAGAEYACQAAHRLVRALYEPVELAGLTVDAHGSIGIALFPGHGTDPDALVRRATVAAFQAKHTASGYSIYAGGVDQECTRRLALMGDLHRAIEQNELLLYCQPKVNLVSGRVCGAEGLVRWQHPLHGMLSTGEFIKLAEHGGLITPLTHWVLDAAFAQSYAWHEAGVDHPLSVNLSAHDLRDPRLLERIKGLFATWGTRPELIQFELTESALMEDPAGALATLTRLKDLGVELFIDDFGTGYSSLSYLQKLPVDSIKIDQSFVGSMLASADSGIIVRSTIDLGHNLGLDVVAEGVDSQEVWERLSALGCDTGQGYYISRPIPADQLKEWEEQSRWHG